MKRLPVAKPVISVFLALIMLAAGATAVWADEANDYFRQGVAAARRGDNSAAVRAFEYAKRAGLESAELYYNLGVIYYRMKVYAWSEQYFSKLINDDSYSALAYYNLGLIAASKDNIKLAIRHFQTCYSTTQDKKLKALSALALKRLDVDVRASEVADSKNDIPPWRGLVLLSIARDDNVGLENEEIKNVTGISEKRDTYYEALATTNGFISGNRQNGFSLSGFANGQKYATPSISDTYDYTQMHIALNRDTAGRYWQVQYGLGYDQTTFGGMDFQRLYSVFLRGKHYFGQKKYVRIRLASYKIDADPLYRYLDGSKHQLKFDFTVPGAGWKYRLAYNVELNRREDFQTATTYISYSPLRNSLGMIGYFDMGKSWQSRLEIEYRSSIYGKEDVLDVATGNSYSRKDNRYKFNAGLIYNISHNWQLSFDYSYTRNDSNRVDLAGTKLSDYQRNLIGASLIWYY